MSLASLQAFVGQQLAAMMASWDTSGKTRDASAPETRVLYPLCQHVAMGSLWGMFKGFRFCLVKGSGACLHHSIMHLQHYPEHAALFKMQC